MPAAAASQCSASAGSAAAEVLTQIDGQRGYAAATACSDAVLAPLDWQMTSAQLPPEPQLSPQCSPSAPVSPAVLGLSCVSPGSSNRDDEDAPRSKRRGGPVRCDSLEETESLSVSTPGLSCSADMSFGSRHGGEISCRAA
eukprot:TRINITY_DN6787_c0_g2_i1.p3 TRINITY_DN6787_c0_g2~~TRINITY_DN6787_c0_g2_i1.p3  ORF type:complete len:141 (+),score=24.59 TRINITY_DN6787_c0_g2_i1:95-517(+)